jgi:hypothetical protein
MLLTATGILVVALSPQAWPAGFALVSFAYAMACSSLWILVPEFVPLPSLGFAFAVVHVINDVVIMIYETGIGATLDAGHTFQKSVLPIMLGFAALATIATLLLMRPLRERAEWNAAMAAACAGTGEEVGDGGRQGSSGSSALGSLVGSASVSGSAVHKD